VTLDAKDRAEVRAAFGGWLKGKTRRRERLAELGLFNRRSVFGVIEYAPTAAALPYAPADWFVRPTSNPLACPSCKAVIGPHHALCVYR
jgi:hypothetical protein